MLNKSSEFINMDQIIKKINTVTTIKPTKLIFIFLLDTNIIEVIDICIKHTCKDKKTYEYQSIWRSHNLNNLLKKENPKRKDNGFAAYRYDKSY